MKLLITLLIPVSLIAMQDKYIVPTQEEREQILAKLNDLDYYINKKFVTDMTLSINRKEVTLVFATTQMTRNRNTGKIVHHHKRNIVQKSEPQEVEMCTKQ